MYSDELGGYTQPFIMQATVGFSNAGPEVIFNASDQVSVLIIIPVIPLLALK
jgi:hypothetical protein